MRKLANLLLVVSLGFAVCAEPMDSMLGTDKE